MRQEVLVITAADVDAMHAGDSRLGERILELFARIARSQRGPVIVRIDFPYGEHGGLEATPRRLGWIGRAVWRLVSRPLPLE